MSDQVNDKQKAVDTSAALQPNKKRKVRRDAAGVSSIDPVATARSAMLRESISMARKKFGDKNICVAGEAGKIVIGLPMPCLALEFLIQNTVWPLGRFTQIVGKHGTCKSALCLEIARWFKENDGITYLFENETKYSSDLATSVVGYANNFDQESLVHMPCNSLNDWQAKLQHMTKYFKETMSKKEIGKTFPVLYIVDSLMGKLAIESQERIEKEGYADRSHPLEAMMINSFMKKYPQDIEEWPMCLLATNHLKPSKTDTGAVERKIAGGASPGFQETFELEMSRDQNHKINLIDEESFEQGGIKLKIACKKNSLGETDRSIKAELRWYQRECPETGEFRQYTYWDWNAATVHLLSSYEGFRKEKINEIVHIGGDGNKRYSKTLGIPSSDPVTPSELGALIEADADIKHKLRRLFGIKPRKEFKRGENYDKQLAALTSAAEKTLSK
jgi:hypothetical protein